MGLEAGARAIQSTYALYVTAVPLGGRECDDAAARRTHWRCEVSMREAMDLQSCTHTDRSRGYLGSCLMTAGRIDGEGFLL